MLHTLMMLFALSSVAEAKKEALTDAEQDHMAALRVWMTEKEIKSWGKLKSTAERDAWLQANGEPIKYWERFYQYAEDVREAILAGEVRTGWTQDKVFMAWGQPYMKKRLTGRNAGRSELLTYRFEVNGDGEVLLWERGSKETYDAVEKYTMEIFVDDAVVTELVKRSGWQ